MLNNFKKVLREFVEHRIFYITICNEGGVVFRYHSDPEETICDTDFDLDKFGEILNTEEAYKNEWTTYCYDDEGSFEVECVELFYTI